MKALVFTAPRKIELRDVDEPRARAGEVVVTVEAAGICGSDVHGFSGASGRRVPPLVMGHEVAGTVLAVGEDVSSVRPSDRVAIDSIVSCGRCPACRAGRRNVCQNRRGVGIHLAGAYAERLVVPASVVVALPQGLAWDRAALIEPLAVALHAVDRTVLPRGGSLAVVGTGAIGLLIVLAARSRGVGPIIAIDRNERRLGLAHRLGAEATIHADSRDVAGEIRDAAHGQGVDAVIDAVGIEATARQAVELVRPGGQVTLVGNTGSRLELDIQDLVGREVTVRGSYGSNGEFAEAMEMLADGRIDVDPLIELTVPLAEGPSIFRRLADTSLDAVKVILHPQA